jgi:hypothetical protein
MAIGATPSLLAGDRATVRRVASEAHHTGPHRRRKGRARADAMFVAADCATIHPALIAGE